jgi:hypothetical protein
MTQEDIKELERLLELIKQETETYVDHDVIIYNSEKYALMIAIAKYIERFKW